ncbi:fructoselysine and glucoselysine-specific PTS system IID component [Breznakia sp. PF5-3]|uniref:PTS system mannose/fructose/sorbose family transporter subunit IID n=1 Tax=unclassified Breznakia TaxID=2623764 RepID=UPI002404B41E|nr:MULTISPECIES: PTS system mannose/fructose/sorbose family transporter subunit IID [unclassified Breznakia]MDF9824746.1 fructoselysine and glucoselysine-specific PTS system IID component [Breznakia sp. PM6-1]MDF9835687.1 fructoselysine and glucoselysine-specific PTS system IID component [Breznakia sp. PF5-3]MDF9837736.1 fructoselysine and glucoselysine-specific PTS system IID component [Breznakia sp. PFB2-8]MDF9859697.1 fructoselysine and glucoselysine-specific PTS system IID component [Brezna
MEAKKLTKKDLWRVFWNQMAIRGTNNYERQQNGGFTQAMMPVIERVYDNDDDKRAAYERHMEYFLTQDMVSAIPVGIAAAMEEMHANDPEMDPSSINAVKTALMGPLAGLGDSLLNGTARPILASLAISLVQAGLGWAGPILFVVGMSIVSIGIRYLGVFQGYKQGVKLVEKINSSGLITKITDIAAIAAYTIVGGFIPALVFINIPIEIASGDTVINIQETLDGLMPGVLGLSYTFLMYWLVTKKKISAVKLIFLTMVVAIAGVYLGILG